MRKFDFVIQTILFAAAITSAFLALTEQNTYIILGAISMFFMGVWQLMSATGTSMKNANANRYRKSTLLFYWIFVAVYFIVLAAFYFMKQEMLATIWFFAAWGIAIYYYVFTIRLAFMNDGEKKSFMDIGNER